MYSETIKNKFCKFSPTNFTDFMLITVGTEAEPLRNCVWKRNVSTELESGGEEYRILQRYSRQRARSVVVIVVIMIMAIIITLYKMAGYSNSIRTQATSKLTSPTAVQFVQQYRIKYVCRGFVQAQAWRRSAVPLVLPNV
jgi:hypothetical protein